MNKVISLLLTFCTVKVTTERSYLKKYIYKDTFYPSCYVKYCFYSLIFILLTDLKNGERQKKTNKQKVGKNSIVFETWADIVPDNSR